MTTYILTAIGLAMDAFAVSVASVLCIPKLKFRYSLRAAVFFGVFQFFMPVVGYLAGSAFRGLICRFDHWIAFALLAFVGSRMIMEGLARGKKVCDEDEIRKLNILDLKVLTLLAIATSIDALAVGLSYSLLGKPLFPTVTIIGIITFAVCLAGCEFGKCFGMVCERFAETGGGIVLVGIGIKILAEHLIQGI